VQAERELLQIVLTLARAGRILAQLTAGSNSAINTPMIAITTSSSTSVKP